jgi:ATP-dependent DNA helicase RecG
LRNASAHQQLLEEGIDDKRIAILEHVLENGSINNTEVRNLFNVSKPTATRLLQQMEPWFVMQGIHGKGTIYELKWKAIALGL